MTTVKYYYLLLVATLSLSTRVSLSSANEEKECGLYLAISSTSTADDPKWGVFAGKAYSKRTKIGFGDVAIHAHQLDANALSQNEHQEYLTNIVDFIENFIWV